MKQFTLFLLIFLCNIKIYAQEMDAISSKIIKEKKIIKIIKVSRNGTPLSEYEYNSNGLIISESNIFGFGFSKIIYLYNNDGKLTKTQLFENLILKSESFYFYNEQGLLINQKDSLGGETKNYRYEYNSLGQLKKQTILINNRIISDNRYEYVNGFLTSIICNDKQYVKKATNYTMNSLGCLETFRSIKANQRCEVKIQRDSSQSKFISLSDCNYNKTEQVRDKNEAQNNTKRETSYCMFKVWIWANDGTLAKTKEVSKSGENELVTWCNFNYKDGLFFSIENGGNTDFIEYTFAP